MNYITLIAELREALGAGEKHHVQDAAKVFSTILPKHWSSMSIQEQMFFCTIRQYAELALLSGKTWPRLPFIEWLDKLIAFLTLEGRPDDHEPTFAELLDGLSVVTRYAVFNGLVACDGIEDPRKQFRKVGSPTGVAMAFSDVFLRAAWMLGELPGQDPIRVIVPDISGDSPWSIASVRSRACVPAAAIDAAIEARAYPGTAYATLPGPGYEIGISILDFISRLPPDLILQLHDLYLYADDLYDDEKADDGELSVAETYEIAGKVLKKAAKQLPAKYRLVGIGLGTLLLAVAKFRGEPLDD